MGDEIVTGGKTGASLSAIDVALPDRTSYTAVQQQLLSGYEFLIEPLAQQPATCQGATSHKQTYTWTNTKLTESVKQGCDYSLGMRVGQLATDGKSLQLVLFSNWTGAQKGLVLSAGEIGNKPNLAVTISLLPTKHAVTHAFVTADATLIVDGGDVPLVGTTTQVGAALGYDWRPFIKFNDATSVQWTGNSGGSALHADVMMRTNKRHSASEGLETQAHETAHQVHAELRMKIGPNRAALYFENGKYVVINEPKAPLVAAQEFIPMTIRGISRTNYDTYLTQRAWTNMLYLWDEWTAYIIGARVGVQRKQAGQSTRGDLLNGVADFLYFSAATIAASIKAEPNLGQTNPGMKAGYAFFAELAMKTIEDAKAVGGFDQQRVNSVLGNLRNTQESAPTRAGVKALMGDQWTKSVLGF